MHRFGNAGAEDAHSRGFGPGLPKHIARKAHQVIHLLIASHTIQDVRVIGLIYRWPKHPQRWGLLIEGKWFVTFVWIDGLGATEINLERR